MHDIYQRTEFKSIKKIPYHPILKFEYNPIKKLSASMKYMPQAFDNFEYLLVATCNITKFVMDKPLKMKNEEVIGQALIHRIIEIKVPPKLLIADLDAAVTGKVI